MSVLLLNSGMRDRKASTRRTLQLDAAMRNRLSALVSAAPVSEEEGAALAVDLSLSWAPDGMLERHGVDLARVIACKLCGYNAHLHARATFLLKAICGARRLLDQTGATDVAHALADMRYAEYVLGRMVQSQGGAWTTPMSMSSVVRGLRARYPAASHAPGHESVEAPFGDAPDRPSWRVEPAERADRPAALFVASMERYLRSLAPVMNEMARRDEPTLCVVPQRGLRWVKDAQLRPEVRSITIEALMGADLWRVLSSARCEMRKIWRGRTRDLRRRLAVDRVDLWPLLRTDLRRIFRDMLPSSVVYVESAQRLHEAQRIGAVVMARSRRAFERSFAFALRARGAPVIVAPHGHVGAGTTREIEDGFCDCVDLFCAWSDEQRRPVEGKASFAPEAKVVVTGAPAWDALQPDESARSTARRRVRQWLRVDDATPIVMLATQIVLQPFFETVLDAWSETERGWLLVKAHPIEDPNTYAQLVRRRKAPRTRILRGEIELHEAIRSADAFATMHSTTNLEAIALGAPVISLCAVVGAPPLIELSNFGLPQPASGQEFAALLQRVVADPVAFRARFARAVERAQRAWLPNHGEASRRVTDAIVAATPARAMPS